MATPVNITGEQATFRQTGRLNLAHVPPPAWALELRNEVKNRTGSRQTEFIRIFGCESVLKQLIDNPDIVKSLQGVGKTLVNVPSSDERLKQFLITASVGYHCASSRSIARPGDLAHDLLSAGKAARKLAKTIKRNAKSFRAGTDRLPFLLARIDDPTIMFPTEGEGFFKSGLPTLHETLQSFADALDAQAKQLKTTPKSKRTATNIYLDSLIQCSHQQFKLIPYALIANIASVVTVENVDESTVRKRPIARKLAALP